MFKPLKRNVQYKLFSRITSESNDNNYSNTKYEKLETKTPKRLRIISRIINESSINNTTNIINRSVLYFAQPCTQIIPALWWS